MQYKKFNFTNFFEVDIVISTFSAVFTLIGLILFVERICSIYKEFNAKNILFSFEKGRNVIFQLFTNDDTTKEGFESELSEYVVNLNCPKNQVNKTFNQFLIETKLSDKIQLPGSILGLNLLLNKQNTGNEILRKLTKLRQISPVKTKPISESKSKQFTANDFNIKYYSVNSDENGKILDFQISNIQSLRENNRNGQEIIYENSKGEMVIRNL